MTRCSDTNSAFFARLPCTAAVLSCAVLLLLGTASAHAQAPILPRSLARAALDETMPFTFDPMTLQAEDFVLEPIGQAAPEVQARFVPGSLQWVRVSRYLVVPRALVLVEAKALRGGSVSYANMLHPLAPVHGSAQIEVPVALVELATRTLCVRALDARGALRQVSYRIRVAPRSGRGGQVAFDTSCSPYAVSVAAGTIPDDTFLYVGCRMIHSAARGAVDATLELYLMFVQAGELAVEAVPARPRSPDLWVARAGASPFGLNLSTRGHTLVLAYRIPEHLHDAFIGVGLGPYLYRFRNESARLLAPVPLVTLYGGYSFNESTRIVYFNATALQRYGNSDNGLYLWLEEARFVDDRLSFNLLLGANLLLYRSRVVHARVSAPQGFELIARDIFGRGRNLTAGAFLYPKLFGRSYYNVWLRWGPSSLFAEINFISWQEPGGKHGIQSRSIGLTFGTPVLHFL